MAGAATDQVQPAITALRAGAPDPVLAGPDAARESGRATAYRIDKNADVRADILQRYPDIGDILDTYVDHQGPIVHKWHHYLPIYEKYLAPYRGRPFRFLEIGVNRGGSLRMWRQYFGPQAVIFGIDIRDASAAFNGLDGQVRIGSQADPDFLRQVVDEMGGIDVVLDDGSHRMDHIQTSLDVLFPLLSRDGLYCIEDLHTAYWPRWGGGFKAKGNFFNNLRRMVDDMHRWYHEGPIQYPLLNGHIGAMHIHDSLVILEKKQQFRPIHSYVGQDAAETETPA